MIIPGGNSKREMMTKERLNYPTFLVGVLPKIMFNNVFSEKIIRNFKPVKPLELIYRVRYLPALFS